MKAVEFNYKVISLQPMLEIFARKFTSDIDEGKDLLQETLLKAFTYKDKFSEKTNLKAWLYTIMRNTFINQYRKSKRVSIINDQTAGNHFINSSGKTSRINPENILMEKEILTAINGISEDLKIPFWMHFKGFKYKEISKAIDIPIGTVKSRIFLARKELMSILSAYDRRHR